MTMRPLGDDARRRYRESDPPIDLDAKTSRADERPVPWSGRDILLGLAVGLVTATAALVPVTIVFKTGGPSQLRAALLEEVVAYGALSVSLWHFTLRRRGASLASAGFRRVGLGVLAAMIPATFLLLIVDAVVTVATAAFVGAPPDVLESELGAGLLWPLLGAAVVAPPAEEFIFRGILYRYLRKRLRVVPAALASSAWFALLHFFPAIMPAMFCTGVVLALLTERYGSVYPAITVHALVNGVAVLARATL